MTGHRCGARQTTRDQKTDKKRQEDPTGMPAIALFGSSSAALLAVSLAPITRHTSTSSHSSFTSSISSTMSYGMPASASSTLSCPGIRPATQTDRHTDRQTRTHRQADRRTDGHTHTHSRDAQRSEGGMDGKDKGKDKGVNGKQRQKHPHRQRAGERNAPPATRATRATSNQGTRVMRRSKGPSARNSHLRLGGWPE